MWQIMRSSLDYAGFAQLCGRSPIMREIMRAHNRIIPRSLPKSGTHYTVLSLPVFTAQKHGCPKITEYARLVAVWLSRKHPEVSLLAYKIIMKNSKTSPASTANTATTHIHIVNVLLLTEIIWHICSVVSRYRFPCIRYTTSWDRRQKLGLTIINSSIHDSANGH